MQNRVNAVRKFLGAEEIPRWFGLSVVLIYLVGLGTVANIGILYARNDSALVFQRSSRHALQQLADQLAAIGRPDPAHPVRLQQHQKALQTFAGHFPNKIIRTLEGKRVIASTNSTEIGLTPTTSPTGVVGVGNDQLRYTSDWRARFAVPYHRFSIKEYVTVADHNASESSLLQPQIEPTLAPIYVEAIFPPTSPAISSLSSTVGILSIILAVLGALFMVYRCLREQLRGVSSIADRLQHHRQNIEHELGSLRIANSMGFDQVIASWNELVELTQQLQKKSQHADATEELSRALQQSGSNALAEALNAAPDGMVYITDENRIEYLNSAACRIFGWDADEVKQWTIESATSQGIGERALEIIRNSLQPDGSYKTFNELLHLQDEQSQMQGSYRVFVLPMHRAHHNGECLVIVRDVSQQMRAERAREEFVSQVSHELRTPLTNIRAYAETLSSGMFEDPKVMTECYNVITKETRRLSRLVEDILSVSQLEVGTIEITPDTVDLGELLSECVRDIRGLADEKDIDLQLVLPSKMDTIMADRDKLAVVINNLLGNAIKYTLKDGTIIVGVQRAEGNVVITFKDNGIGIDPDDHVRVFEKFQRGNQPEVLSETGSGIGLYTSREIVRRHGGEIDLISEKNEGSTFMVRLPHRESRASTLTTREDH